MMRICGLESSSAHRLLDLDQVTGTTLRKKVLCVYPKALKAGFMSEVGS